MSKHLVLLGALTLSGCALLSPPAPTVTPVHLADPSQRGFYIECSSMKACFLQAQPDLPARLQGDRPSPADALQHPVSGGKL